MVCTANDLQEWKDFPKGLRVLLLERDTGSASEIRAKLVAMDYNVSIFYDENEALSAMSSRPEGFHVAIVEVSTSSSPGGFKFLENSKDIPTIMTSNTQCLSTMMKCIALGAVEFLNKPLSEDKLRNIWQHVVHKAFNAGSSVLSKSLKPVEESVESMVQLKTENGQHENRISVDVENLSRFSDNEHDQAAGSDRYPAPSTPQIKNGGRLLDDGDCQEQTNFSIEKESGEHDGESKSVEIMCENLIAESTPQPQKTEKTLIKDEEFVTNGSKCEHAVSVDRLNRKFLRKIAGNITPPNKGSAPSNSCENKAIRKKMKIDWTTELHKKFVQAVEQLGIEQAIPSRILELMKVDGLTRHNVASHLQKYRMHKRLVMPKEEGRRRWQNLRDSTQRSYYLQIPIMAYPPYLNNHTLPPAPPLYPIWGSPSYPMWQCNESWHWKPYPGVHVDAWGCPAVLPPTHQAPYFPHTQNMAGLHNSKAADYRFSMPPSSFEEHNPADEVVDKVVKEAMSKPWLPLPLGLKPPSTDCVLNELSKQGISTIIPLHPTRDPNPTE